MLSVHEIYAAYDRVEVLRGITLEIAEGEIVCLLGANGAGKTSLLKVISGLIHPHRGKITFRSEEINGKPPNYIVKLGICHVPEGRQIFSSLSVRQNLLVGTYSRKVNKVELRDLFDRVFDIFPVLKKKTMNKAANLSGGEQQMLAIGRALMARPKVLLLDEPSLGLAPILVKTIFETIQHLPSNKVSILLVEQNARSALQISNRAHIMEAGRIVKQRKAKDLLYDDEVRKRYLGR